MSNRSPIGRRATARSELDRAYDAWQRSAEESTVTRLAHERSMQAEREALEQLREVLDKHLFDDPRPAGGRDEEKQLPRAAEWANSMLRRVPGTPRRRNDAPHHVLDGTMMTGVNSAAHDAAGTPRTSCDLPAEADVAARLLGTFAIAEHGRSLHDLHGAKPQLVLRYLLAHPDQLIPRDVLVELLWPGIEAATGRRNLHQVVYSLRRTLRDVEPETRHIVFINESYGFDPDLWIWTDVAQFDRFLAEGRHHERRGDVDAAIDAYSTADQLYLGDFLADAVYDEWTGIERERLRLARHEALDRLGDLLMGRHRFDEAAEASHLLLTHSQTAESAHRRIIECHAASGRRGLAIEQYHACVATLERELGVGPSPETDAAYRRSVG